MKKIFILGLTITLVTLIGCSNDSPTSANGGLGGGPTGTGGGANVTFTTAAVQDNQGQFYFELKPSTDIVLDQVRAQCPAIGVDETLQDTSGDVYNSTDPIYVGPVQGIQSGQEWTFNLMGKIGTANGQQYNETVTYNVP